MAQVLDYGAALWKDYSDPDDFITELDSRMQQRTNESFSSVIAEFYGLEGDAAIAFPENLKATMQSGQFRFVVLMDTVEERLKNLIAYVNANSAFDVLGVGLDFYQHENIDILIPTLHGAEAKKAVTTSKSKRRRWDEGSFFADATARLSAEQVESLKSLFNWTKRFADNVRFGTGVDTGSFNVEVASVCVRSIFPARSDGSLTLNFQWLTEPESAKAWRKGFGQALLQNGFSLPADFAERYVRLPDAEWVSRLDEFLRIVSASIDSSSWGTASFLGEVS